MAAALYDITIEQGAQFVLPLTWTTRNADGTPGDPVDLTGYTAKMQIRDAEGTVLVDLSTDDGGGIVIDGPNGKVTITIDADMTTPLCFDDAAYDLKLINTDGVPSRLVKGTVTFSPQVTQ